ncbi:hypothetical protein QUF49_18320 [Fictibacillus sp. b24]|uniref:hypothetical protein n=1 Tax=Fictibacillus sp. b24 TaxID=3055863 RepID=UPI0025A0F825|nr:hypothetical protein [Fictibacillus sp. b24]MDM5317955.1 hypothetical protein [Fictibacillus sp. b24]
MIGVQGARLLGGGSAGQVRHLRAQSAEVAHRTPPGKRATCNGNQHFQEQQRFT